ncbi:acyltransferase [Paenibacillus mesophilus]|uniref:acyltransferase family protein n=1 Tax=Paenibacillus mesophilus TaxID=2582849 RepID=UPI00110D8BD2|nr:acyltransferase [Paenibacillus mesophilus]TMV50653.1 acyltransferase [Paenibacillus mesophilus]
MDRKPNMRMIQASRGAAVFLVMLFHAAQVGLRYFQYDFLGISEMGRSGAYTFFFVLTGYLMVTLYRRHFGNPRVFGTFLLKRFYRIYPLYWLIMLVVVPIFFLVPSFGIGFERDPSAIIRSLLLWPQATGPILPVAWSLSYIVWFYLVFSLCFLIKEKVMIAIYSSWMTIIVLNVFGLIQIKDSVPLQFLFSIYHLEFVLGILVAATVHKLSPKYSPLWMICGAVVYVVLWICRYQLTGIPYADFLHTLGSVLLLIGILTWEGKEHRLLQPLAAMGNASYSILLASLPMMSITFKLARAAHLPGMIGSAWTIPVCFLSALGLCMLFYRWIERPLNRLMRGALPVDRPKPHPVVNQTFIR